MPDPTIPSAETGTRQRTAERVSLQTGALVIAISRRRRAVALHVDGGKYVLDDISTLMAKASQALATLETYRRRLGEVSTRLTALELEGRATPHDVLTVLQRTELVIRMAAEIERHVVELGTAGRLIKIQLDETMLGVYAERVALIREYPPSSDDSQVTGIEGHLERLTHQELRDLSIVAQALGPTTRPTGSTARAPHPGPVAPHAPRQVERLGGAFDSLDEILAPSDAELAAVDGVGARVRKLRGGPSRLQDVNLVERQLWT